MAIALPVHYAIGVTLALAYWLATSALGLSPRNPFTALSFGLTTNALPWLVMFPRDGVRMEHTVHREHDCSSAV